MPYLILTDHPECSGFAVVKEGTQELMGCHRTQAQAEDQLTAINISENRNTRALPENYRPALSEDVPQGRNCGNCIFFEDDYCTKWDDKVVANYYCNAWVMIETRKKKALDILEKIKSVRYNLGES